MFRNAPYSNHAAVRSCLQFHDLNLNQKNNSITLRSDALHHVMNCGMMKIDAS